MNPEATGTDMSSAAGPAQPVTSIVSMTKVNDMAELQLADVFVEMADTLVDEFDLIDFLHVLTERCVELLGVSAAGLLLADGPESLQVVAHRPNAPACWSCSNCKPTKAHV